MLECSVLKVSSQFDQYRYYY